MGARAAACVFGGGALFCDEAPIPRREVAKHGSKASCWLTIDGVVYDVTQFASAHPGGAKVLLRHCGKDVTKVFRGLHGQNVLEELGPRYAIGTAAPVEGGSQIMNMASGKRRAAGFDAERLDAEALADLRSVPAIRKAAIAMLPESLALHVGYGAEDQVTIGRNEAAWGDWVLFPRVLAARREPNTAATVLGCAVSSPILIAPFATAGACHPDGERALAAAASEFGSGYAVPHFGGTPLEDLEGLGHLFFQLYPPRRADGSLDRDYVAGALAHAEERSCKAVFVTVDTNTDGNREETYRSPAWLARVVDQIGAFPPVRTLEGAGLPHHPGIAFDYGWDDIAWMRTVTSMKVVVKGVLCREDAARAAECADAILVSNHGGRQLDGAPATADVLRECVAGAGGRIEVLVDGGIVRGKDVFRALALGADGVLVGKAALYGLAVGGEAGVARVLELLDTELKTTMQLAGCEKIADIAPDRVRKRGAAAQAPDWIQAAAPDGRPYWYASAWTDPRY